MIKENEFQNILHCINNLTPKQKRRLSLRLKSTMADHSNEQAYELVTQEELDLLLTQELTEESSY